MAAVWNQRSDDQRDCSTPSPDGPSLHPERQWAGDPDRNPSGYRIRRLPDPSGGDRCRAVLTLSKLLSRHPCGRECRPARGLRGHRHLERRSAQRRGPGDRRRAPPWHVSPGRPRSQHSVRGRRSAHDPTPCFSALVPVNRPRAAGRQRPAAPMAAAEAPALPGTAAPAR